MKAKNKFSDFGNRLKEAIGERIQNEVAEKLGISSSAITKYKKNSGMPSAQTLKEISDITGYSIHWLLTGKGIKKVEEFERVETALRVLELYEEIQQRENEIRKLLEKKG